MNEYCNFEYTVINENLESAISEVLGIISGQPGSKESRTENINMEQINTIIG
jgi:guanylate kinase